MIVAYKPRVAFRSVSKNGVSSKRVLEKKTISLAPPPPPYTRTSLLMTSVCGDNWKTGHNFSHRWCSPFGSLDNKFTGSGHRGWITVSAYMGRIQTSLSCLQSNLRRITDHQVNLFSSSFMSIFVTVSSSRYIDWLRTQRSRSRSSSPGKVNKFHFSISPRPAVGSTQPPVQWVLGGLSPG
jgi:hypothetical protein